MKTILEVKNLSVSFNTYAGKIKAVRNISFDLREGETLVVVGESGCGKTVMSKSIMRLLPRDISKINKDAEIIFDNKNILNMRKKELQDLRGKGISMIFQDPMTYLNPTMKIGEQIAESLIIHEKVGKREALKRAIKMLELVKIPDASKRVSQYPHEFSGGMRQRVIIAIALACNPKVLIADEPTTALDVTTQADIMELIGEIQDALNTGVILITHDLGVAAEVANRIQVMYAGEIIERGTKEEIFKNPNHPYTRGLLRSIPSLGNKNKKKLYSLDGTPPDLFSPPKACSFAARCEYCMKICLKIKPEAVRVSETQSVTCWLKHPLAPPLAPAEMA